MEEDTCLADGKFDKLKKALEDANKFNIIEKIKDYERNTGAFIIYVIYYIIVTTKIDFLRDIVLNCSTYTYK